MKYRHRMDIIADILKIAEEGVRKTKIMYIGNLSHKLLEKYLNIIERIGFVQSRDGAYETTEKGHKFLERYIEFSNKYSSLASQIEGMRFEREILEKMCQLSTRANPSPKAKRKN